MVVRCLLTCLQAVELCPPGWTRAWLSRVTMDGLFYQPRLHLPHL